MKQHIKVSMQSLSPLTCDHDPRSKLDCYSTYLIGGLEHVLIAPHIYVGNDNPSWLIFFKWGWNHQPTRYMDVHSPKKEAFECVDRSLSSRSTGRLVPMFCPAMLYQSCGAFPDFEWKKTSCFTSHLSYSWNFLRHSRVLSPLSWK